MAAMTAMKPNLLYLLLTFSLLISTSSAGITHRELESAIFALRAHRYNLFGNAIAVSDLSIQLLSFNSTSSNGGGFTFLAPPNSALFSLDMSTDAFTYVHSLRLHVLRHRLSFSDLRNLSLSSKPYLETLAPGHFVFLSSSSADHRGVSVNGVRVSEPDIYIRTDIAVHGLDGILVSREDFVHHGFDLGLGLGLGLGFVGSPPPTPRPTSNLAPHTAISDSNSISFPPIDALSPEIEGVPAPSPHQFAISPEIEGVPANSPHHFAISPEIEGVPANSPHQFATSPEIEEVPAPSPYQFSISPEIEGVPANSPHQFAISPEIEGVPALSPHRLASEGVPAPATNQFTISPEIEGVPAFSPHRFASFSSETTVCGDSPDCEPEIISLSPNAFFPPMWSISPPAKGESPGKLNRKKKKKKVKKHNKGLESQSQGQGQGHGNGGTIEEAENHSNFAKYNHPSFTVNSL